MQHDLAKSKQLRQNEAMMKRLIPLFLFLSAIASATAEAAVCGVHATVPNPAKAYSFENAETLVPPSLSGWIICRNDPINKVDPTGENIGALTSVPVIDVIVGIPSIVGTLGSVGLIVAVAAVPMAMKEMVAPGPSIEESEPWEVDSSTLLAVDTKGADGKPDSGTENTGEEAINPNVPASDVVPGSLKRKFPGEHFGKTLNEIKDALKKSAGKEKKSLQTAKKILEQAGRLLDKRKK